MVNKLIDILSTIIAFIFIFTVAVFSIHVAIKERERLKQELLEHISKGGSLICYKKIYIYIPELVEKNGVLYVREKDGGRLYHLEACSNNH